jgi:hypothetical protein
LIGLRTGRKLVISASVENGNHAVDNYYRSPSPQEQRYRQLLDAIRALGSNEKELADALDDVVWEIVNRAVGVAVADHDRRIIQSISNMQQRPFASPARTDENGRGVDAPDQVLSGVNRPR